MACPLGMAEGRACIVMGGHVCIVMRGHVCIVMRGHVCIMALYVLTTQHGVSLR